MKTEEERQEAKERAVLIALNNKRALIRNNLEVYGMKEDESKVFISKSDDYNELWSDALNKLNEMFKLK